MKLDTASTVKTEPAAGGTTELLRVALPLVISSGSLSLMYFVDRMFLTWYSIDAMSAALPAGVLHWTLYGLFLGTATYVNTFVAQYDGAGRTDRVGASLWQAIYFSIAASAIMMLFGPLAGPLFDQLGHDAAIRAMEIDYFAIMCYGTAPLLLQATLACYFSGRGRTAFIMWVNLAAVAANIVLDYAMVFGVGPFPEMGIRGAALATVLSQVVALAMYVVAIWGFADVHRYALISAWRFDGRLFARLMRFGLPNGLHMFIDVICFTLFIHLVGMMGKEQLAASNLAFGINSLAFVPMLGFGMAIATLTGQRIGEGRPELAERTTWLAFRWTSAYMLVFCAIFVVLPEVTLLPFVAGMTDATEFAALHDQVVLLLRFVAVYCWFDALTIVFGSALRGAGDTRFPMIMTGVCGWLLMVVPTYLGYKYSSEPMLVAWTAATLYISVVGVTFLWRFLGGRWKSMRVIEPPVVEPFETLPSAVSYEPAALR